MAKFINNKTGNILTVTNEKAAALMEKSERYTKVDAKVAKDLKAKAEKKAD